MLAVAAYARAEAEAKPGFAYSVGTPLVYNTLPYVHHAPLAYHAPLVYTAPVGCQNNEGAAVPCAHGVLPYGLVAAAAPAAAEDDAEAAVSVEKREAEPTAEVRLANIKGCSREYAVSKVTDGRTISQIFNK